MKTIATYESFNARRYGNPWVCRVNQFGALDFSAKIGAYSGRYNGGEAGELYVYEPEEGAVYAFGQKAYRSAKGGYEYRIYMGGEFRPIEKQNLVRALRGEL